MEQTEGHIISIENRKKFTATQIQSVDSFSSNQLVLSYSGGRIVVTGSDLKITSFSKSNGSFVATGNINGVRYTQKGAGLKKLFK
ncbi:MAG: YabP/YqfC family sporulation protein [Candidatus Coproplasma sp.]